ncbi:hypothetical protein PUMCH_000757 [Australozyma saopauloensis]|uniref:tRNA (guanine(9)-N1)-methyltransferase n=1 Tax=Australozyma saopauloensis TaxID=291208 RepID=A0AAX4H4L9_9ASCO|nr:hypothetical protein PUMCH_000757 [[Candida] saopauloensis]
MFRILPQISPTSTYSMSDPEQLPEPVQVNDAKRQKVELPPGMSKNAWKKLQKQKRWDEQKDEYRQKRREKKKIARVNKKLRSEAEKNDENYHLQAKREKPQSQIPSGVSVIMDCEFDELMSDKEIVSLSNQITRCYSAKRHSTHEVDLVISTFNKRLKARFEKSLPDYKLWQNLTIKENDTLEELLPKDAEELSKFVYLTADTEEEIDTLQEGYTYIMGGIVDKNRHKQLCLNKAKKLGLKVARLPIGKYIQMNSRHVLATSHVYEIMCMCFELNHDWEKAFNSVLPPRKLRAGIEEPKEKSDGGSTESVEPEDKKGEDSSASDAEGENGESESEPKTSETN